MTLARPHALEFVRVCKRFARTVALDNVSVAVRQGTVHAILGENGAGKTTLMRVAYGMELPDSGCLRVAGSDVKIASPLDAIGAGIGMVHQHFTLVPSMTVAENLSLGGSGILRMNEMRTRVHEASERIGLALDVDARVETLSVSAQQRVEIAKALIHGATILILDEPTAMLAPAETNRLLQWLRTYTAGGNTAVLITHKLHEALTVADDVTILRHGRVVEPGNARHATVASMKSAMLGEAQRTNSPVPTPYTPVMVPTESSVVYRAANICITNALGQPRIRHASFVVHAKELVGVVAVEGSGQRELLRALAGRAVVSSGQLERPHTVGFVPEDRHEDAVMLGRSLTENVALRGAGSRRGIIAWTSFHERTLALMSEYDVRGSGPDGRMRSLSGGNQQKLVLARELASIAGEPAPSALVVENPTRGLDVRATAEIHTRLRSAAHAGAAVIIYSSDLDEVLSLATRILVIFDGIVCETPIDRGTIGRVMLGLP